MKWKKKDTHDALIVSTRLVSGVTQGVTRLEGSGGPDPHCDFKGY